MKRKALLSLFVGSALTLGAAQNQTTERAETKDKKTDARSKKAESKKKAGKEQSGTSGEGNRVRSITSDPKADPKADPKPDSREDPLRRRPGQPGTPPTFPRNDPGPGTVKPPDPTAPTVVKP